MLAYVMVRLTEPFAPRLRFQHSTRLGALTIGLAALGGCDASQTSGNGGRPSDNNGCITAETCGDACGPVQDPCSGQQVECPPCDDGGTGGDTSIDAPPTSLPPTLGFGLPSNVTPADASAAYQRFRNYVEDCGGGVQRVRAPGTPNITGDTVSEAIGYGMLLAVAHHDKVLFDGLLAYYKRALNPQGLMGWDLGGCGPTIHNTTPAIDADLDAAMALIQAECRWGGTYGADATAAIEAIALMTVERVGNDRVLRPGYSGAIDVNPSYFSPGYYRAFAFKVPSAQRIWMQLASDTYTTLEAGTNPGTGLVPDWMMVDGGPAANRSYNYGYDACRTPWRIATDYLWWGTEDAKTWLDRLTAWAASIAPQDIVDGYTLAGPPTGSNKNEAFVGGFAAGAMASNGSVANSYFGHLITMSTNQYYPDTLRALYLTTAAGMFVPCPSP